MKLKQIIVSIILFSLFLFICSAVFKGTADNLQADSALTAESEVSSMGESNMEKTEINLENLKEIYFAGGCFWGVEEYFSRIPGVYDAVSGYANGNTEPPTYEEVCSNTTGFAETVRVRYDPAVVSLRVLTGQYFKIIDPVSVNRQDTCPECGGTGAAKGTSPETCPDCHGSGYVTVQQRTPFGVMQSSQPCSRCGGKGKIIKSPCSKCHGSGKTSSTKRVEVKVPAGIDDDQSMRLTGLGDAGLNGGPSGDLIVIVTVRPDAMFERDRFDVHVTVPVTYSQAVLGAEVVVPTIDGKVQYTVPEGTQSGTTFRLRGKGIQYVNGRGRGDQYVKVVVEIPKKLTKTQRDALKKFEDTLKDDNYEQRKGFFKSLRDKFENG